MEFSIYTPPGSPHMPAETPSDSFSSQDLLGASSPYTPAETPSEPFSLQDLLAASWPAVTSSTYRNFLHNMPHTVFHPRRRTDSVPCMACSVSPCALACTRCELELCESCAAYMRARLVNGNLARLISLVARWKLGYSQAFLEREHSEAAAHACRLLDAGERAFFERERSETEAEMDHELDAGEQSFPIEAGDLNWLAFVDMDMGAEMGDGDSTEAEDGSEDERDLDGMVDRGEADEGFSCGLDREYADYIID